MRNELYAANVNPTVCRVEFKKAVQDALDAGVTEVVRFAESEPGNEDYVFDAFLSLEGIIQE